MKIAANAATLWSVGRWCVVGAAFTALTVPLLFLFREIVGLPLAVATLVTWEIGTVLRFLVNDRWVFRARRPTWQRFFRYHASVAGTFIIWWVGTNVLSRWWVHYLLASILATGLSLAWSLSTNYLWVWRGPAAGKS